MPRKKTKKPAKKASRKRTKPTQAQLIKRAKNIHKRRTYRAKVMDSSQQHKDVVPITEESVLWWSNAPGGCDLPGIDTLGDGKPSGLEANTVKGLKAIARDLDIKGRSRMVRAQLLTAIKKERKLRTKKHAPSKFAQKLTGKKKDSPEELEYIKRNKENIISLLKEEGNITNPAKFIKKIDNLQWGAQAQAVNDIRRALWRLHYRLNPKKKAR